MLFIQEIIIRLRFESWRCWALLHGLVRPCDLCVALCCITTWSQGNVTVLDGVLTVSVWLSHYWTLKVCIRSFGGERDHLEDLDVVGRIIFKLIWKKSNWEGWAWTVSLCLEGRNKCDHGIELPVSLKCWKFRDWLRNRSLFKELLCFVECVM
jgi:hypothetical protein